MSGKSLLYALFFLAIGLAAGIAVNRYLPDPSNISAAPSAQPLDKLGEATYVCPMHPEIVRNKPDHCPICGMDLVRNEHHDDHPETAGDLPSVTISPAVINNLGVHTMPVARQTLWRKARMSGYIQGYNPGGKRVMRVPIAGRIAILHVKDGQWVTPASILFELDIPERVEAQTQHLALLTSGEQSRLESSRLHLRELAFTGPDIEQLEKTRKVESTLKVYAPQDSQVGEVTLHKGDSVTPGSPAMMLMTMGEALVDVDVFQSQVLWLKSGDRAELRMHHFPGQVWKGVVSLEGLRVNPEHRTYGVRLSFRMPEEVVKGDMYGEVQVFGAPRNNVLTIPHEALIRTQEGDRVVVALGDGRFQPVKVKSGMDSDGQVEILSGLKDGQKVVVSAQFLLDSESNMRAEFLRMEAESTQKSTPSAKQPKGNPAMPAMDNMAAPHPAPHEH